MRRTGTRLATALLVLAFAHTAAAQTVDEVIDKSIAAQGGRAALAKLKSRKMTGTITLVTPAGDIAGTVEIQNATPNKSRSLIKADLTSLGAGMLTVDQRFNGTSGYVMDSLQGNRDITGQQLDNMRNTAFPHPFVTYKDQGISAKLIGKEKLGDRDVFVITFEPPAGSTVRQFIDAETYIPKQTVVKINVPQLGVDVEQTTEFDDYRDVDGVKIPFKLTSSSSVQSFTIVFTKIEHNVPLDETLFSKPAAQ